MFVDVVSATMNTRSVRSTPIGLDVNWKGTRAPDGVVSAMREPLPSSKRREDTADGGAVPVRGTGRPPYVTALTFALRSSWASWTFDPEITSATLGVSTTRRLPAVV